MDDAASYWEQRLATMAEAQLREQQHWTRVHPPNVRIVRGESREETEESLGEWLDEHGQEYDYAQARSERPPF